MITTLPQKANNATHLNGFPNLNRLPDHLDSFFQFLRKADPNINTTFTTENNSFSILINYPKNNFLDCMQIMNNIPAKFFHIKKFSHSKPNLRTVLILTKKL